MGSPAQANGNRHEFLIKTHSHSVRAIHTEVSNANVEATDFSFSNRFAQNRHLELKSRGEVMSEVKSRYDAKILKIRLKQQREIYVVRLLMPNGKVKTVTVSARR